MKKCSTCKVVKSFDSFNKDQSTPSGYHYRCKVCRAKQRTSKEHGEYTQQYYKDHKNHMRTTSIQYKKDNREEVLEYGRQYCQDNTEKRKEYAKRYYVLNRKRMDKKSREYHIVNRERLNKERRRRYYAKKLKQPNLLSML